MTKNEVITKNEAKEEKPICKMGMDSSLDFFLSIWGV
jgi:hypothetical protein